MPREYLGHLPTHDPLFHFLRQDILPMLDCRPERPEFRVFNTRSTKDVYLYEEKHSGTMVVGKFFAGNHMGEDSGCRHHMRQMLGTLDLLKPLYPTAVVTDAQSAYAVPELRTVGLMDYFCPVIVSGDYGYRKPDPRLFGLALSMLAIDGEQAVYVGAQRFRDVLGARQLGMKTVLHFTGPSSAKNPEIEPDYVIHRFGDLPAALEFLQMH